MPKPKTGYEQLLSALADPSVRLHELMEIARRAYRQAGNPYGDTQRGFELWMDHAMSATAN